MEQTAATAGGRDSTPGEKRRTPRQKAREDTEARIVAIGNRMLDEEGAESLSLRAIARELGIVSSAVYRYVRTRDDLLTILIADAFTSIADAVDAVLERERTVAGLGLAMLEWSRRFPRRWALIYGTPMAAYAAPREATVEPGTRVMVTLVDLVAEAGGADGDDVANAHPSRGGADAPTTSAAEHLAAELATLGVTAEPDVVLRAITAWVAIVGLISSLRFGQFGPGFDDVEDDLMTSVVRELGW